MQTKTIKKWISNFVTIVLFLILILMIFLFVSTKVSGGEPQVFGYQLKTVLSGSMEPGIKTGSIILVKPGRDMEKLNKGDVITFINEDRVIVTHRILEVIKSGEQVSYRTKGDNNKTADPNSVLSNNILAKYTGFTIPYVGYIADFAKSKAGNALFLILPGILLICYSLFSIWNSFSQLEKRNKKTSEDGIV
ncbi:signal peptidase I SipW [Neobacillus sp. CF12]|uniref:signal peptidase I SipW n=1 Tax=Neobacillus sp. CF12 TaxID=3055864 RepID=UPI0025A11513|nr:signal peptidase I [Neobacillus sp. CF12]MDM5331343.1 signal peptidase I [Neobacillus sp. CF12]